MTVDYYLSQIVRSVYHNVHVDILLRCFVVQGNAACFECCDYKFTSSTTGPVKGLGTTSTTGPVKGLGTTSTTDPFKGLGTTSTTGPVKGLGWDTIGI